VKPFGELGRLILWRWSEDFVAAMLFLHFGSGTAAMQYGSGAPFLFGLRTETWELPAICWKQRDPRWRVFLCLAFGSRF
jgi:hypothetical protein